MSAVLSLKPSYYEALKRLTLELAGVKLGANHKFLVETRLAAMARREGFDSLPDLIEELFSRGQTRLAVHVVSALVERDLHFFEDAKSLSFIEDIAIPRLHQAWKGDTLRVLCFGCGSGQDALSITIMLAKLAKVLPGLKFEVVGADYPSHALDRARAGQYTHFEVQRGLRARDLVTYFSRKGEDWQVRAKLQSKLTYQDMHLMSGLEALGKYQLVLFRNQLQRYTPPAQMRIMRNLAGLTLQHGYLALGSSENLKGLNFGYDKVAEATGIYKKQPDKIIIPEPEDDGRKKPTDKTTFTKTKKRHISMAELATRKSVKNKSA